ncbi:unnamed protein product [Cylicocyclus nassatus]|uniref:Uncharacterized protein n=1 Tax=Cylicocyclus nassatus TaxID=53992 RepID=A0AA36M4A5_CYLNA|nr:unnamed protein product [Cylicocyclus nassatus]
MMPNGRANGVPKAQDDRDDRMVLEIPNDGAAANGQDGDRVFEAANEAGDDGDEELRMPDLRLPNGFHHEDDEDEVPEDPDNWRKVPHQRAKCGGWMVTIHRKVRIIQS